MNQLSEHFSKALADSGPQGPVGELLFLLAQGILDGGSFSEIISRHGVSRELWFRKQRLDLVMEYITVLLNNGPIQTVELASIADLKKCLGIAEGEFISLRPAEVATVLVGQLVQILEDDWIDESEDLYQLGLQTVFDLSYDQYLQLTRAEFERAMASLLERVGEAKHTGDQARVRELEARIAALEPLYRLSVAQPRTLGALF